MLGLLSPGRAITDAGEVEIKTLI